MRRVRGGVQRGGRHTVHQARQLRRILSLRRQLHLLLLLLLHHLLHHLLLLLLLKGHLLCLLLQVRLILLLVDLVPLLPRHLPDGDDRGQSLLAGLCCWVGHPSFPPHNGLRWRGCTLRVSGKWGIDAGVLGQGPGEVR